LAEQLALQEERLPLQIERVRAGSPFYRDRLGPVRTLAELAAQPFVTKAELLAAQADDPPLGPNAGAPREAMKAMARETEALVCLASTTDMREGFAAFREKRSPSFSAE